MDFLYRDGQICVCIKPAGVLSTDEPGGLPQLVREALDDPSACVRTVHRLDRVVSGLMVLARTPEAASRLSAQVREGSFGKEYLAVIHGVPEAPSGTFTDLLLRSKPERKTYVVHHMEKGVQEAVLRYRVLGSAGGLSRVKIRLLTGRTHQIRVSMAELGHPLLGDGKYGNGQINRKYGETRQALYSYRLAFDFTTDAGALEYLRGKVFIVSDIPFQKKYFS